MTTDSHASCSSSGESAGDDAAIRALFRRWNRATDIACAGRFEDACREMAAVVAGFEMTAPALRPNLPSLLPDLATFQTEAGDFVGARATFERLLRFLETAYGMRSSSSRAWRGGAFAEERRRDRETVPFLRELEETARRTMPVPDPRCRIAAVHVGLARTLLALNDRRAARRHCRRAASLYDAGAPAPERQVASELLSFSDTMSELSDPAGALRFARLALEVALALPPEERFDEELAMHHETLALRLEESGDESAARRHRREARRLREPASAEDETLSY